MNICAICHAKFEAESPAILFVSRYGTKRPLCEECERLLDLATAEEETHEKEAARESILARSVSMKDPDAMRVLSEVLDGKFTDEASAENEEDFPAEPIEGDSDEEEEELEVVRKSTVWDYLIPAAFGVALIGFLLWYYFLR